MEKVMVRARTVVFIAATLEAALEAVALSIA